MAFFLLEIIKLPGGSNTRIPILILNTHDIPIFDLLDELLSFPDRVPHLVADEEWLVLPIVHIPRMDGPDCCAVVLRFVG